MLQSRTSQAATPTENSLGSPKPFGASPIWDWQRAFFEHQGPGAWSKSLVPHYVTSNSFIAYAYAQIVLGYLRDLVMNSVGTDEAGEPLYIFEVGSGSGRFAHHFLHHFFSALDGMRLKNQPVCYVMSDVSRETIEFWRSHQKFLPYREQRRLDFALLDVERDQQVVLIESQRRVGPADLKKPPVVIANYVFDGLRQDLFFFEGQQIHEGWVSLERADGLCVDQAPSLGNDHPFDGIELRYWSRPIAGCAYPNAAWNRVLTDYSKTLSESAVLFPSGALQALDRLCALCSDGMLLLSADRGSHHLERFKQPEPEFSFHGSFSLLVNYHAIAAVLNSRNAATWHGSVAEVGLASLAALFDRARDYPETTLAIRQWLTDFSPDNFYSIRMSLEGRENSLDLDQMRAFLALSHWDAKLFSIFQDQLEKSLPHADLSIRLRWLEILDRIWELHLPIPNQEDLAFDLAFLSGEMQCWSKAAEFYRLSLEYKGSDPATHHNLGMALQELGRHEEAAPHPGPPE